MSERCPLIDNRGVPEPQTGDKFGAVWDSGLADICMQMCFNRGKDKAMSEGLVEVDVLASKEEQRLAEGDTGMSEGIVALNRVNRRGYVDINDGTDPEAVLVSSSFRFICTVEKKAN